VWGGILLAFFNAGDGCKANLQIHPPQKQMSSNAYGAGLAFLNPYVWAATGTGMAIGLSVAGAAW